MAGIFWFNSSQTALAPYLSFWHIGNSTCFGKVFFPFKSAPFCFINIQLTFTKLRNFSAQTRNYFLDWKPGCIKSSLGWKRHYINCLTIYNNPIAKDSKISAYMNRSLSNPKWETIFLRGTSSTRVWEITSLILGLVAALFIMKLSSHLWLPRRWSL